jgi:hypothetical protein
LSPPARFCSGVIRPVRLARALCAIVLAACTPLDMSSRSASTIIQAEQTLRAAGERLAALDRARRVAAARRAPRPAEHQGIVS